MKRRVVITGLGLVCPLGSSPEELWAALSAGRSGVGPLTAFPPDQFPTRIAAEARQFTGEVENFGPLEKDHKKAIKKALKLMSRESQMGVAAAHFALRDAGITADNAAPDRSGCAFGCDYMLTEPGEFSLGVLKCGGREGNFQFGRWGKEGLAEMTPLWMLKYLPNMPGSHIAIFNDLRGPSNSITHREAASNLAIGEAYQTIARGSADRMVAGATGTRVHPMKAVHAAQTEQLAACDGDPATASRPFDARRTGMVLGEGAAAIVLEDLECALARRARIYAEVAGAGSSIVADRNLVARRDVALANAIRSALRDGGATASDVGHIHAHGLATTSCDIDEARAIRAVFGERAERVPVVAAKSYFGNLGAGSGTVELIASVLALREGRLFRTLNHEARDPECPVAVVTEADVSPGGSFLNLSVTPQGQAAVVLVRSVPGSISRQ